MVYKIIISRNAEFTYQENIDYLARKWSAKEIENFISNVEAVTNIIKHNPQTFKLSIFGNRIHEIKIVKQITLFYEIKEEGFTVNLLLFWNNFKNPKSLNNLF